ncbi:hypothetical protein [Mesoterricola silvestris]|uniref:Uncharacterized protein n=1 Tax=Mesoterricola silvestris TaxID=2927979 RepID=A0AA48K8H0_9BACT|nr:hypothetical protein [Mesoterricola silvestris]BDU72904.1 hypothetical protein METEAL_20780 [Mesoterricola silvestris]
MATIYGSDRTRITIYAPGSSTPLARITLQEEDSEGLVLSWRPEGVKHSLGGGAAWANHWTHRGHRPQLQISWAAGMTSSIETWDGSAWGAPVVILTPLAIAKILSSAFLAPCMVEPHLDKAYSFLAQPDPERPFELKDVGAAVHTDLGISLLGQTVGPIPDWAAL